MSDVALPLGFGHGSAKIASGLFGIGCANDGGNHADASRSGTDHVGRISGMDAADGDHRNLCSTSQAAHPVQTQRLLMIGLGGGGEDR